MTGPGPAREQSAAAMSDEEDYGDEEFEDYDEDDFEDYEDGEEEADPNEPRGEQDPQDGDAKGGEQHEAKGLHGAKRIVIGLSDEERYLAGLRKTRWEALRGEVDLQEVALDGIFDMPPYSMRQLQCMGCGPFRTKLERKTTTADTDKKV